MDHEEAIRQNATERYMLDELDSDQREQFEEHFFDCPDCADDVRAAAIFVEHSKEVLAEPAPSPMHEAEPAPPKKKWFEKKAFAWLHPAFAMPALALLLAVIGYQNLFELPRLELAASLPHVLPAIALNLQTAGDNSEPIAVPPGGDFLLNVIIPPGNNYSSYKVDLYNPQRKIDVSLPITGAIPGSTLYIHIPGANRESGIYKLAVQGRTAEGQITEVGSNSFEIKIQK
jgi:hypothetical protein